MSQLPCIPLSQPLHSMQHELGRSLEEYGFVIVSEHGIPRELIARAERQAHAFFELPDHVKRSYHQAGQGGARGYTPFGSEHAKDSAVHDLKEFWHIGCELPPGDPLAQFMPPNVWPGELPGFRETMLELFAAFEKAGGRILQAVALHLGLERDFFAPTVQNGNSVLRLLHYPPVPASADGASRAAAHGDINTITLLLGAQEAGLELLSRRGQWIPVSPPPGALAVNIGDMLERLTAGRLPSTTHRVVNPQGQAARRSRYSMPFFLHFRPDYVIDPIEEGGELPITAHDFLLQRLREIGLT